MNRYHSLFVHIQKLQQSYVADTILEELSAATTKLTETEQQVKTARENKVDLPMPPFCVANATKISLLIVPFILIVEDFFFYLYADLVATLSASVNRHMGGSSRIRFCGEAVRRTSDE